MAGQEAEIGALGVIILSGVVGRLFLRKTGISDVLILLLFGALAGALLPVSLVQGMGSLLLPLGAIALLMIILDEGLHLPLSELVKQAHKAVLFSIISFSLSFIFTFALCYAILGQDMLLSLVISAIFASVAPELVSGFLSARGAHESARGLSELESTLSDALSVILALLIISSQSHSGIALNLGSLPLDLALSIALSAALGGVFAALWKGVAARLDEENEHLMAIGFAALLYALSSAIGANGVITVFAFGFFLGNTKHKSVEELRRFHSEISFFLRTFFFIYLGILLFHSEKPFEIGLFALSLSLLLAIARSLASRAISFLEPTVRKGRLLESISSRGLTSAVLAVVAAHELELSGVHMQIDLPLLALFVIFFTNAISAFMVLRNRGKE